MEDDEVELTYDEARLRNRWVVTYLLNGHGINGSNKPYLKAFWTANPHQAALSVLNRFSNSNYEVTIINTVVSDD